MSEKTLLNRLDHIEYIVKDVREFVEFWELFGFKVIRETEHHGESAEMRLPGENQPIIEIHKVQGDENPGVNHIAFFSDNIEGCAEALRNKGIEHRGPFFFEG